MDHVGPKENWLSCFFMKKENKFSCLFGHNIIILDKHTTELVLLFHKKTTKLDFLWPNMSQKSTKVLTYLRIYFYTSEFSIYIYITKILKTTQFYVVIY